MKRLARESVNNLPAARDFSMKRIRLVGSQTVTGHVERQFSFADGRIDLHVGDSRCGRFTDKINVATQSPAIDRALHFAGRVGVAVRHENALERQRQNVDAQDMLAARAAHFRDVHLATWKANFASLLAIQVHAGQRVDVLRMNGNPSAGPVLRDRDLALVPGRVRSTPCSVFPMRVGEERLAIVLDVTGVARPEARNLEVAPTIGRRRVGLFCRRLPTPETVEADALARACLLTMSVLQVPDSFDAGRQRSGLRCLYGPETADGHAAGSKECSSIDQVVHWERVHDRLLLPKWSWATCRGDSIPAWLISYPSLFGLAEKSMLISTWRSCKWMMAILSLAAVAVFCVNRGSWAAEPPVKKITHSFLATGVETFIVDGKGKTIWTYPQSSRDGWVLPNRNVLLALTKSKIYPGGAAVEVTPKGKIVFEFKGTQSEVNTVEPLANGRVLLTEAGNKPRLLEVDRDGKIAVDVPLTAQTKDHHLQTRMSRKLPNGNYLVPQLLDRVVREYDPKGKIVWEVKTPHMPFTAIRLPNGNTLIGCTLGNLVIEVDKNGKEVWRITNADLPAKSINDACGVQRLPNGNTVITSHHATANQIKLQEVTRDKKVVWTYTDSRRAGIHEFQILDTNGNAIQGRPLR